MSKEYFTTDVTDYVKTYDVQKQRTIKIKGGKTLTLSKNTSSWYNNLKLLTEVTVGNSVTSLGIYCFFFNCSKLTQITIPNSVTSLGDYCFQNCTSLKVIDFSNHTSIPSLGTNAFKNIPTGFKIIVPKNLITQWKSATNWSTYTENIVCRSNLIEDQTILGEETQAYTGNPIRPIQIKDIAENLLIENVDYTIQYQNNINVGTATFTITGIGNYQGTYSGSFEIAVFSRTRVTIQPTSSSPTFRIYSGTKKSTSSNIKIDWGDGTTETLTANISNKAHTYTDFSLKQVKITDDVTTIAFGYSSNYAHNTLIRSIDEYAEGLSTIGANCFYYADNLTSVDLEYSNLTSLNASSFRYCSKLSSFNIGSKLKATSTYFLANTPITDAYIPSQITSIGIYAFTQCDNLSSIIVDSNNTIYDSRNNCNAIITTSTNTMLRAIKNSTIPSTVVKLGVRCYAYVPITDFTLPTQITTIGTTTTAAGGYVFQHCEQLSSISLHDNLTELGYGTFQYCTALEELEIPPKVSAIRAATFGFCSSMKRISFARHTSVPSLASINALTSITSDYKIEVPSSLYNTWIATTNWSNSNIKSHIIAV